MDKILKTRQTPFYEDNMAQLFYGDTFKLLSKLPSESIDMIFADPPYFLSSGGISCSGGKQVSVNKGKWDTTMSLMDKHRFNRRWLHLCRRILKLNGTIWISGSLHNIYSVGMALEQEGYRILNNITWQKTNPPPNLACRCFTHSTETVLWACKNEKGEHHFFNYALMKKINDGKQMKDVWTGSLTKRSEKQFGKHPTQKPEYLLQRILLASTELDQLVLDPFTGSSTTGVIAKKLKRRFIGFDNNEEYLKISADRLKNVIYEGN